MRRALIVIAVLIVSLLATLTAFDYLAPYTAARNGIALERWRAGLQSGQIKVGEFDIAYLEGGAADAPPLILIHGFGADKDNFTRVAGHLTGTYHVLIPDLPGFGESSKLEDVSYRVADQAERVRAFVQAMGLERVHLGGSSMGGHIAAEYALKYPTEVASLWLLGPAGLGKAFESELQKRIRATGRNPLLAETPEEFPAIMAFVMEKPPFFPYSIKKVLGERAAADYPLHSRIFAELSKPATPSPLLDGRITGQATPTLVVWGNKDRALNYEAAQVYKAEMPRAEIIVMDGIGHLPMIEAPRQSAQDYLAFRDHID